MLPFVARFHGPDAQLRAPKNAPQIAMFEAVMSGFITAHRAVLDHPLFKGDALRLGAWIWLIAKACWKPTPFDIAGRIITLERGQLCASRAQLAKAWGMSPSAVERFLTRLETEQMIGRATGQGRSIITLSNYDKYQAISDETGQATEQASGQPSDSHRTTKEQGNKGIIEEEPIGSPSDARAQCQQVVDAFNATAKPLRLSACQKLSPSRLKSCKARIRDHGLDAILSAIHRIPDSAFLRGETGKWAGANIDFILRPDTVTKILEGKYNDPAPANQHQHGDGFARAIERRLGPANAGSVADDQPQRRTIRAGEGDRQGAFALPSEHQ